VEYRGGLKEVSAPAQIAEQSKQQTAPPVAEVEKPPFDDDLPDFAKAPDAETPKKKRSKK